MPLICSGLSVLVCYSYLPCLKFNSVCAFLSEGLWEIRERDILFFNRLREIVLISLRNKGSLWSSVDGNFG